MVNHSQKVEIGPDGEPLPEAEPLVLRVSQGPEMVTRLSRGWSQVPRVS